MGVYHLMGVGTSLGAVTAPLSYLADRFKRDNPADQELFRGSGERSQGPEQKRGDIQGLVFFTSAAIIAQKAETAQSFTLNERGNLGGNPQSSARGVPTELCTGRPPRREGLLPPILRDLNGDGRPSIELYWCEIDLNDPVLTFERVAQVIHALKGVGGLGKEIWINLTSGSNIINTALNLAVSLGAVSARMYYVLNTDTKYVHHTVPSAALGTVNDRFWVDLPIIYAEFDEGHQIVLEELATIPGGTLELAELISRSRAALAGHAIGADDQAFRLRYIQPLLAQRLIIERDGRFESGPGWQLLRRYYTAAHRSGERGQSQAELARGDAAAWLKRDDLRLYRDEP